MVRRRPPRDLPGERFVSPDLGVSSGRSLETFDLVGPESKELIVRVDAALVIVRRPHAPAFGLVESDLLRSGRVLHVDDAEAARVPGHHDRPVVGPVEVMRGAGPTGRL